MFQKYFETIYSLNDGQEDIKTYNPKKNHNSLGHRPKELFFGGIHLIFRTFMQVIIPNNNIR